MAKKAQKVLVKWNPGWADEADFPGFIVMKKSEWKNYVKQIKELSYLIWYFGTNEFNEYYSPESFLKEFKVSEISQDEADTLEKFFEEGFGSRLPDPFSLELNEDSMSLLNPDEFSNDYCADEDEYEDEEYLDVAESCADSIEES